ncbi:MAG: ABC transporter ATP-binding protein [Verrucomicrobia bacterium]|nr:ABC transporter ATP-binding protein [Verrucomicrobiota bacterium]
MQNTLLEERPASHTDKAVAVRTHALSKEFNGRLVLHSLDFRVDPGELVAVVGKSGCGKSTLLRLICGLEKPSSGWVEVDGERLNGLSRQARLMFQDAALLPWKSVKANVALAAPRKSLRDRVAEDALQHVGLRDRAQEWPSILSGGQRQRVALARALASDANLLLFDEPLGALDALTRLEMQSLVERLWIERRFSAILVTHDVEEAVALADRILLMEAGRVTFQTAVSLERPRDRASAEFTSLKETILERILGRHV